jgi:hypothetical protein
MAEKPALRDPVHKTSPDLRIRDIVAALHGLRYGSIEIVVHDAKVVQIERRERLRFESPPGSGL